MSSESIGRLHEAVVVYVYAATLVHARRTTVALGLECGAWAWLGWGLLGGNLGGGHCTRLLEIPREPCTEASPSGRMANCEPRTANCCCCEVRYRYDAGPLLLRVCGVLGYPRPM